MRSTRVELNCWLDKEDAMCRQRSKINWFQEGDRNTNFFHAKASTRYKKNLIDGFKWSVVGWGDEDWRDSGWLSRRPIYCQQPYKLHRALNAVRPNVSLSMNQMLQRDFTTGEVGLALKQMYSLKPPGPDGMPPLIFQHFWSTSGEVVTKTVLDFLNLGVSPPILIRLTLY